MLELEHYSLGELNTIARRMGIKEANNKKKLISQLKFELSQKYVKIKQLGQAGKEGVTFMVYDHDTENYYAMKTFKKTKSVNAIQREYDYQKMAKKIAPKVIYLDLERKSIVMEKLDETLLEIIKKQNGTLTISQQSQILNLFLSLDEMKIFHNDPNPLNIMYKKGKFYIIDFGFARTLTSKDIKDYGSSPNKTLMCLGLLIWLKKIGYTPSNFKIFMDNISEQSKIDFELYSNNKKIKNNNEKEKEKIKNNNEKEKEKIKNNNEKEKEKIKNNNEKEKEKIKNNNEKEKEKIKNNNEKEKEKIKNKSKRSSNGRHHSKRDMSLKFRQQNPEIVKKIQSKHNNCDHDSNNDSSFKDSYYSILNKKPKKSSLRRQSSKRKKSVRFEDNAR